MNKRAAIVLALIAAGLLLSIVWIHGTLESPAAEVDAALRESPAQALSSKSAPLTVPMSHDTTTTDERRAVAETAADSASATRASERAPLETSDATLVVRCLVKGTDRPLDRIRVRVAPKENRGLGFSVMAENSKGTLHRSAVTGADGEVEFALPAELELRLWAQSERKDAGDIDQDVTLLRKGERRTLVLHFTLGDDLHFLGLVLAREDRTPIAGARVLVLHDIGTNPKGWQLQGSEYEKLSDAITRGDGRFEVTTASRLRPFLRVDAENYGPRFVALSIGHERPDSEQVIALDRSAAIDATVIDGRGASLAGAVVHVLANAASLQESSGTIDFDGAIVGRINWQGTTAGDGRCSLQGLPARVPLSIVITDQDKVLQKSDAPVSLEPLEVRALQFRIGSGCAVSGTLLDEKGAPVARCGIWLQRATYKQAARYFTSADGRRLDGQASTDDNGKFTLENVASGSWWIGAAAVNRRSDPSADEVAPLANEVNVPPDTPRMDIVLKVQRGLFIRGRVVDGKGAPVLRSTVHAYSESLRTGSSAPVKSGGNFILGPLMSGSVQLTATGTESNAGSDPVTANAGDDNVVLKLRSGGSIAGKIVDATRGEGCSAELTYGGTGSSAMGWRLAGVETNGSFKVPSLEPGTYDLIARHSDGRIGFSRGIVVESGSPVTGVVLTLERGGKLRIRYDGAEAEVAYEVSREGAPFLYAAARKGESSVQVVPAGKVSVRLQGTGGSKKQSREVEVSPDEEKEIVFTDDP